MALTYTSQRKDMQITKRIPPNCLLQQYVFHMTTATGDNTLQASLKNPSGKWSLIPGTRKTASPIKLYPSHSASMFTCCRCGLGAQVLITVSFAYFHRSRLYQRHL
ncbi:hypothetical protein AVEN_3711-1 [Araneus ventricosus]|uniref:Uncharacterized protein n=1 Tax=Araneus ventricosus TaxID=182803 RepID=A0A4Y2T1R0_ARAVE|nr:hypothetical protein AVEN_50854-1 [Araneus ventricosus]GBN93436.1 hypothetical protein AVEN_3711-1 [Araneus ventricosus]